MKKQNIFHWIRIAILSLTFISFGLIIIQIKTREIIDSRIIIASMIFLIIIFFLAKFLLSIDTLAENE